ncbi:hypothetical protein ACFFX0_13480 [Citricoccus parietis]|uniref:Uncharacterized protein n=1 Tax=Citricoccus parietis TaxID=592307 RepID=A0ABV5FZP8_9MICC
MIRGPVAAVSRLLQVVLGFFDELLFQIVFVAGQLEPPESRAALRRTIRPNGRIVRSV